MKRFRNLIFVGFVLLFANCSSPPTNPETGTPPVQTLALPHDQDLESCSVEPKLFWCQAACMNASYQWCEVKE